MAQQTNGEPVPLGFGGATASVGDHIAHFYRGDNEMLGILGPYIAEGLRRGERCAVISSEPTADKLRNWLTANEIDVEAVERGGQLLTHRGEATVDDMRSMFERVEAESLDAGYKFVRVAGDGGWALAGRAPVPEMLQWEALYDEVSVSAGWQILALCQFDLMRFGGDVVMDVLRAHPLCVLGQVMLRNPLHVEPEKLLKELAERS
jgi:hypothetical protein